MNKKRKIICITYHTRKKKEKKIVSLTLSLSPLFVNYISTSKARQNNSVFLFIYLLLLFFYFYFFLFFVVVVDKM